MAILTRLSWYKRDPAAFLDGTMTMTLEETGAYAKMLELIYVRDGACPDSERWIAGHLNCDVRTWRRLRARLIDLGKLYVDGDALRNPRADSTIASGLDRLEQTIIAGRRSGEKRRKSASKSSDFNGSGGTPVQADAPTPVGETKTQKEKKESYTAAAESRDPRARAREAAAAAIPEADQIPVEAEVLLRVVAEERDEHAAARQLAVWKAAYPRLYGQVLAAALAQARNNIMVLAAIKFEAERERTCRAQAAGEVEGAAMGNGTVVRFALEARRARILNGTEDDDEPQSRRDVPEQARGRRISAPEGADDAGRFRRLGRHLDGHAEELPPACGDAGD